MCGIQLGHISRNRVRAMKAVHLGYKVFYYFYDNVPIGLGRLTCQQNFKERCTCLNSVPHSLSVIRTMSELDYIHFNIRNVFFDLQNLCLDVNFYPISQILTKI